MVGEIKLTPSVLPMLLGRSRLSMGTWLVTAQMFRAHQRPSHWTPFE
jgi:hypothetical protein